MVHGCESSMGVVCIRISIMLMVHGSVLGVSVVDGCVLVIVVMLSDCSRVCVSVVSESEGGCFETVQFVGIETASCSVHVLQLDEILVPLVGERAVVDVVPESDQVLIV